MLAVTRLRDGGMRVPAARVMGWLAVAVALLAWSAAAPRMALDTAGFVLVNLGSVAPVIAFAVLLSAYANATGLSALIAQVFVGRPNRMIVAAALFGAVTPICGIAALPIVAGLLASGVPLAPVMAFWLSSPVTDPAMLAVTAGTLGIGFAIGKSVAAAAIGLFAGFSTRLIEACGFLREPLRRRAMASFASSACSEAGARTVWAFWRDPVRYRAFRSELLSASAMMVTWLALAFALESVLTRYLPPDLIVRFVGSDNAWAVPVAVAIGTPLYVDGYAALPLIRGLMDLGMAPGAAMAFLISGGVTSAYASVAVLALVRLPVFVCYLLLAAGGAAGAGYLYAAFASHAS